MTREELQEELQDLLHNMDDDDLIQVHNEYCDVCNMMDDYIYINDEDFFNEFYQDDPFNAIARCYFGKWEYNDKYVQYNGYGNLESFTYNLDDYIYIDDIVDYIIENDEDFYNDDIRELLEEYQGGAEDEEDD